MKCGCSHLSLCPGHDLRFVQGTSRGLPPFCKESRGEGRTLMDLCCLCLSLFAFFLAHPVIENGQVECPQGYKRLNRSHCQGEDAAFLLSLSFPHPLSDRDVVIYTSKIKPSNLPDTDVPKIFVFPSNMGKKQLTLISMTQPIYAVSSELGQHENTHCLVLLTGCSPYCAHSEDLCFCSAKSQCIALLL